MKNYVMLEGKKIEISDETAKSFREGLKDDTIYVPDCIEFEKVGGGRFGLKFGNDQCLFWGSLNKIWRVGIYFKRNKIKCKLIPCEREELAVGDWAYATNIVDYDNKKEPVNYKLIISDKEHLYIRFEDNIYYPQPSDLTFSNWYKVVPVEVV